MALRVWLPLNGNLNNQGLSNVEMQINAGTPTIENGKIGKCYSFTNGTQIKSATTISTSNYKNISICAWVKNTYSDSSWSRIGGLNSHTFCHLDIRAADKAVRFFLSKDGTSNAYDYVMSTTFLTDDKWHHVCGVVDESKLYIYIDGVLENTANRTSSYIADTSTVWVGSLNNGRDLQGSLNDFRVYDEALSPKQVKEISKGLVAHYKLDAPKANENFILQSNKITSSTPSTNITRTLLDDGSLKIVAAASNGNYCTVGFAVSSASNVLEKLTVGDTYTISCDVKVEEGSKYPTLFINNGNAYQRLGGPSIKLNTWQRIYYTKTWNEPGTGYGGFALHLGFSDAIGTYYFKNFKLEKGTLTPWIPAPTDSLYTSLGYANDICTDVSGNGYAATKNGTLIFNADSPRYSGSTIFNSGYLHKIPSPLHANSDAFTISCWFYPTTSGTQAIINDRKSVGDGLSIFYYSGTQMRFDTGSSYQWVVSSSNFGLNKWNFLTFTWDKNEGVKKYYLNGDLINSTTSYGTIANIGDVFSIGNSSTNGAAGAGNQVYGSISDFRIYATALSADDILTMYKNSGIIDNKNNVYTYEFKEE